MKGALFAAVIVLIFWANPALVKKTVHWTVGPAMHAWRTGDNSQAKKITAQVPKGHSVSQSDVKRFRERLAVPGGQVAKPNLPAVERPKLSPVGKPAFSKQQRPNLSPAGKPNLSPLAKPNLGKERIPRKYMNKPPGVAVGTLSDNPITDIFNSKQKSVNKKAYRMGVAVQKARGL